MSDKSNNTCDTENRGNQTESPTCTEPKMFESPSSVELCSSSPEKELALIRNDELNSLGEKWMEHEDDDGAESDEPEIIIDTIVNPLAQDDTSSDTSLKAVRLTRSAENVDNQQECNGDTSDVSKPTEFVIVSTTSGSTVKFPDDTQIKDELAEPIATTCPPHDDEALENDPMDLLQYNDRSDANSIRSNGDNDDGAADDISSSYSSSVQTTSSVVNISDWSKDYPWLLHEECDEWFGYCLYCDVKLSVRTIKSAKQHGLSLNHKERCENYLTFCEEEAKNNLSTSVAEIKQEYGTESYIAALKLKRKTQAEAFNNYNWRRWLLQCPWLERDQAAGTIGFCKYCSVRLNAEFAYLRQRHQDSGHHRERAKSYKKKMNSDSVEDTTEVNDEEDIDKNDNTDNQSEEEKDEEEEQSVEDQEEQASKYDAYWFYEKVGKFSARCALCDVMLLKRNSFKRHMQSQSHISTEKNLSLVAHAKARKGLLSEKEVENELNNISGNWQVLSQLHPWLEADTADSTYAYCKYCDKRLLYGSSAVKRSMHEQSRLHKTNEQLHKENIGKNKQQGSKQANDDEDESALDGGDEEDDDEVEENENGEEAENAEENDKDASGGEEDEDSDESDEGKQDKNDDQEEGDKDVEEEKEEEESDEEEKVESDANKSKMRLFTSNAEWYGQFAWCKRYRKDAKYCFCSYCKIPVTKRNRNKHASTKRHLEIEKRILRRTKSAAAIKTAKEENPYLWAAAVKGHPNMYFCKCCRVRISKNYSKKQHAQCKIHVINEQLYQNRLKAASSEADKKPSQTSLGTSTQQRTSAPSLPKGVVKAPSFISSIKLWQKRHSWLGYKLSELRSNYAYCKPCEQSLYVRSFKHVIKHQRSSKHLRTVNQLKREKAKEAQSSPDGMDHKSSTKREADQNASTSAKPASMLQQEKNEGINTSNEILTKGNTTIESMQKRYSWIMKSTKPDHAYCRYCDADVALRDIYLRNHSNARAHRRSVVNFEREKPKTEENTHEESNPPENEADDNDVDDDGNVVFIDDNGEEILIAEHDDNWTIKSEMDEHEALDCLLQRALTAKNASGGQREKRKQQKPASNEMPDKRFKRSHLFRRNNDSDANSSMLSSLLSTPLTLASCLGPLIQQQIQQATNSSASASSAAATGVGATAQHKEAENTYDLFFKSVSETMKNLPIDIAAEGKLKVMQIICDLELKALKRKHEPEYPAAREDSLEQTNFLNLHTPTPVMNTTNSNAVENLPLNTNNTSPIVSTNTLPSSTTFDYSASDPRVEASEYTNRFVNDHNNSANSGRDANIANTLTASIYRQTNISNSNSRQPQQTSLSQQEIQQKSQRANTITSVANPVYTTSQPSSRNNAMGGDKNKSQQQAPIIGVMDMNGLQTLQLRNTQQPTAVTQTANHNNTGYNVNQTTGASTSIRCIPFKNLSQNNSLDSSTKFGRIQIPMSAANTPNSTSTPNASPNITTSTPKSLLNLRSIHITKRTGTPNQHQHQHQHQHRTPSIGSVSVVNANTDKNQPTSSYVQASNVQRWTPVNGSSNNVANKKPQPHQYVSPVATYQINRNFK